MKRTTDNWKERIKQNDIKQACINAGLRSTQVYYTHYKLPKEEWSDSFISIMTCLKKIVEEREEKLQNL